MAAAQPPDDERDVESTAPNQGATGDAPAREAAEAAEPGGAGDAPTEVNQGAPGAAPGAATGEGEPPTDSPLGADLAVEHDAFAERPELYVGAAFAGGFVLAQLLRWIRR